ncbi:MAG TPA: FmdB family transcriptional regulator, partial [Candidatus Synoicihabitans sp.]|nr:FmdB family transcriptional regulator [Candidatus Synoicihabitans sp.]
MPIYEYYCPDNHTVYQFYAKTLAQGQTIPKCPDNPKFRMQKRVSAFAITKGGSSDEPPPSAEANDPADTAEDARMEAAMNAMEG